MPKLIRPRQPPVQKRPLSAKSWEIMHAVDEILLDRERSDGMTYRTLRSKLNAVPRPERGIDWTERVVALYCSKGMKSRRCAALKIEIRAYRQMHDEHEQLDAFLKRLRVISAPLVLTNHGLMLPFAHRDQDEVAKDLTSLFSVLDGLGYKAFINSGTLLGAVREGHFLGHDDDADLAVELAGETDGELVASLERLCDALNETGALLKPAWYHKSGPIIKVLVGSGIEVDLFPLWFRDGQAFIWPHTYGELSRDDIFPLVTQTLCGAEMPAPRDSEKMLALNYGPNWRRPDPDFFFPWSDAKIKFASVLKTYVDSRKPKGLFGRLKALRKRKHK